MFTSSGRQGGLGHCRQNFLGVLPSVMEPGGGRKLPPSERRSSASGLLRTGGSGSFLRSLPKPVTQVMRHTSVALGATKAVPSALLTLSCCSTGVGTRNYYRKLGYRLQGPYMVKTLQ
ncbi:hypothetical protein J0S82_015176 [Galemys pyrenaicus]|uniref:Uncharacterized protein n=1 Tax=Galemys pyrenaicus TaxID=202257 RepID=A0A8J6A6X7_GALPY|nr:hypothetical protein J0S82_015176 [Galemys pyrenaicus]